MTYFVFYDEGDEITELKEFDKQEAAETFIADKLSRLGDRITIYDVIRGEKMKVVALEVATKVRLERET